MRDSVIGRAPPDTVIDWDAWRASYSTATFAEQQAFYDLVYELHPEQARFSVNGLEALLEHMHGERFSVIELGGWDGGFAAEILPNHPEIAVWCNYEISHAASRDGVCEDGRYVTPFMWGPYWGHVHDCWLFVASHVIEHLRFEDVKRVFDATAADWIYLQAPLSEEPTDWTGYHGSHILEVGWAAIVEELEGRGYHLLDELSRPGVRCFGR